MKAVFVCDDNTVYSDFWEPQATHMYTRYGLHSILYYLTSEKTHNMFTSEYAKVITIPLEVGIPKLLQALLAKWYFPSIEKTDEYQFICDIDCFILSKNFIDNVKSQTNLYHLQPYGGNGVPGYYVYGQPSDLYNFFQIKGDSFKDFCIKVMKSKYLANLKDIEANQFSKDVSPDWKYFCTEERYAYGCMLEYTGKVTNDMHHPIPGYNRICRSMNSYYEEFKLSTGMYVDYHCPRPIETYKDTIFKILNHCSYN
jgi:hypothetical protein